MEQWGRGDFRGAVRKVIWKLIRRGEPWSCQVSMNNEKVMGPAGTGVRGGDGSGEADRDTHSLG